jgi:hypothetical protein
MIDLVPLAVGLAAGLVGSVSPGPLSVALMHRAARKETGALLFSGLGGAALHLLFVVSVGLGTAPVLLTLAERNHVRLAVSIGTVVYAVAAAVRATVRSREIALEPVSVTPPQGGAAMEGQVTSFGFLVLKWVVVIGLAMAHAPVVVGVLPLLAFAAGVWSGVLGWFVLLLPRLAARVGTDDLGAFARAASYCGAAVTALAGVAGVLRVLT